MSFGRRLALFFVLMVLVPALALMVVLVAVSEDSRRGKADAQLAAGVDTAFGLYEERVADADSAARQLARDPQLSTALNDLDRARLEAFAQSAARRPDVAAVEVDATDGIPVAVAGSDDAFAFTELALRQGGREVGTLKVSSTLAADYTAELHRLTDREVVVSREGIPLSSTVTPPAEPIEAGETRDLTLGEDEFRARLLALNSVDDDTVLLAGPRKVGGFLGIGWPTGLLLIGFLLLAAFFAYGLARALTGLYTRVAEEAVTDPLTGLWNRRRMSEALVREVDRAIRFDRQLSLVIFDVDDFKAINDTEGHPQGDAVIRKVAEVVRERIRSIDVAARYGGDEIALILFETDVEGAAILAERVRTGVREADIRSRGGEAMQLTISVGVATLPDSADDVESFVEVADRALLRAKRAGKDQTHTAPARKVGGGRKALRGENGPDGRERRAAS